MKKQKSGLYRTKVKIGTDPSGKPVNKWISAKTKRELEDKRREVIAYYITGTAVDRSEFFRDYARKWFTTYKTNRSPSTQYTYRNMIENHLIPAFGDRNLKAISATDIQAYINTLSGYSAGLINSAIGTLNGIFKAAMRDRLIDHNPAAYIEKPKAAKRKEKPTLTKEQRAAIESTCRAHKDGLFLAMLYYTGARIGEVCGLQWGDIDFKRKLIHIQRNVDYAGGTIKFGTLKSESSNRYIPIPTPLMEIIRANPIGLPTTLIFHNRRGRPFSSTRAHDTYRRLMLAAGLAESTGTRSIDIKPIISPHGLRHNYITLCYEKGIDAFTASKLAGHSNPTITMNIYTHLSKDHIIEIADEVERIFQSST